MCSLCKISVIVTLRLVISRWTAVGHGNERTGITNKYGLGFHQVYASGLTKWTAIKPEQFHVPILTNEFIQNVENIVIGCIRSVQSR